MANTYVASLALGEGLFLMHAWNITARCLLLRRVSNVPGDPFRCDLWARFWHLLCEVV